MKSLRFVTFINKMLFVVLLAFITGYAAYAGNTSSATMQVRGNVIAALGVTKSKDLVMPALVISDTATAVSVACNKDATANVVYTGNGNPTASSTDTNNQTATCGQMTVAGQTGYTYTVSAINPVVSSGVMIDKVTCISANTNTFVGSADTLYCGATVTVAPTTAPATYDVASTIIVTYD